MREQKIFSDANELAEATGAAYATPRLGADDYFLSRIEGGGHFEDRFGKIRARFGVTMQGQRSDRGYHVDEVICYDDGAVEQHVWDVVRHSDSRLTAYRDDIIGSAAGEVSDRGLNWRYKLKLPNGLKLDFDDWMLPQSDRLLINRARAYKFGIFVGTLILALERKEP